MVSLFGQASPASGVRACRYSGLASRTSEHLHARTPSLGGDVDLARLWCMQL